MQILTKLGWAAGWSLQGSRYIAQGKPCEDSYGIHSGSFQGESYFVLSVADGHGSHEESRWGSWLATVQSGQDLLLNYFVHSQNGVVSRAMLEEDLRTRLTSLIVNRWRLSVREVAQNYQTTDSSYDKAIHGRYGTTLLTVLCTTEWVVILQIGDGEVFRIRNGTPERMFSQSTELLGTETDSLSSPDAQGEFQLRVERPEAGDIFALMSDGISDTSKNGGEDFLREVWKEFVVDGNLGPRQRFRMLNTLPSWIKKLAALGTGDDATLVLCELSVPAKEPALLPIQEVIPPECVECQDEDLAGSQVSVETDCGLDADNSASTPATDEATLVGTDYNPEDTDDSAPKETDDFSNHGVVNASEAE